MRITLQQLKDKKACSSQVRLFEKRYGTEVTVTKRECLAVAGLFDWGWAADHLLPLKQCKAYYAAMAEANKVYYAMTAEAYKVYHAMTAEAYKVYHAAMAEAFYKATQP